MESIVQNIERTYANNVIPHMNSVRKIKLVKTRDVNMTTSTMTEVHTGLLENVKTRNANVRMVRQQTSITVQ